MLFPIDHGNSAMKTVNFVFPSGLIDNPIRPPVDTEMLEYDGKFWTLSGQRISYMRDKTKDERYFKIDDDHIADIIQGRPTILPQEVRDVIFAKVRSYACDILDKLRELQVDLRANPAIFIGGGSILFRSFVEESPLVAHADFVTDPKANAIGYGMLATAQLRRMAPQNYGGEFFAQG